MEDTREGSSRRKKRRKADHCRSMLSFFKLSQTSVVSSSSETQQQQQARVIEVTNESVVEIADASTSVGTDASCVAASSSSTNKKRKWRNEWTKIHKWAFRVKSATNEDRAKCSWCIDAKKDNTYTREGSRVMQLSALNDHARSEDHKSAVAKHLLKLKGENAKGPIEHTIDAAHLSEMSRVIVCIQNVHWLAQCAIPLHRFPDLSIHMRRLRTPDIPATDEYGAYTNKMAAREFLLSIRNIFRSSLLDEVSSSPYISILVDESTDRTLERHLIVYMQYLTESGKGEPKCTFIRLLSLENGSAEAAYDAVQALLISMDLNEDKIVAIATDGASTMLGCRTGMVARFQARNPEIKGVHCIAHREALAVKDALTSKQNAFVFDFIDKLANKVYSWLGKSSNRHEEFNNLLELYDEHHLNVLQIHGVRWLSRGQVMERLVCLMPAILDQWKMNDNKLYEKATIFQVQFMIHFLADVLVELNKLSSEFQRDGLDVTKISYWLDLLKEKFTRKYLSRDRVFGEGTKHLGLFMNCCKDGKMTFVDADGTIHEHYLRYVPIPEKKENLQALDLNEFPEDSGSLAHSIRIARSFIDVILQALAKRFADVSDVFIAMNFFNPSAYPLNDLDRDKQTTEWLESLLAKFASKVDRTRCLSEREDFVGTIYRAVKNKGMMVAWSICRDENGTCDSWWNSFPALMNLWQCCMLIPGSTASCERGFSRQNAIKSATRARMNLETLDALMLVSLWDAPFESIDWQACFKDWYEAKDRRAMPLVN